MPRLSHALPKYCKHRGSGQAVITLNGRDFYQGSHNTKASKIPESNCKSKAGRSVNGRGGVSLARVGRCHRSRLAGA